MPTNSEGVEVNEDGSEITPEQLETSDWTRVVELENRNKVKPLDMEVLAPTSVPHNIPYLEVFRTDEVYYKDYESPFMSVGETSSTESTTSSEEDGEQSSEENVTQTSSGDAHNEGHSSKTKNAKLSNELRNVIKKYFKNTANVNTLVNRYMSARTSKTSIGSVTNRSSVHLKSNVSPSEVNGAIYKVKHKYS